MNLPLLPKAGIPDSAMASVPAARVARRMMRGVIVHGSLRQMWFVSRSGFPECEKHCDLSRRQLRQREETKHKESGSSRWLFQHLPFSRTADDYAALLPWNIPRRAFLNRPQHASTRAGIVYKTLPPNINMPVLYTEKPHRRRAFIADTTALILFFTTTGVINERFIAGMSWDQVLHARMLGAALMVPVGRPYGVWRDYVMRRAQSTNRLSQLLWDSVALVSFQVPIYAAIIAVSGASGRGLRLGVLGATVMMLVLGRPYGAFLNGVRRLFGLPHGGTRPMSLNP
jgi:L-alanine exporter